MNTPMTKHYKIHSDLDPLLGLSAAMRFAREWAGKKGVGFNNGTVYVYDLSNGEEVGVYVYQTETMIVARRTHRAGGEDASI